MVDTCCKNDHSLNIEQTDRQIENKTAVLEQMGMTGTGLH